MNWVRDMNKMPLVAWLGLVVILTAIYGRDIGRGFVKDDVVWVGEDQVSSWTDAWKLMFRTDGFYRPVVAASFALDRSIYETQPFGFGVTNFCLLLLGSLALSYVASSLGLYATPSILVGGLWALNFHGINMALLWISGRTALWLSLWALVAAAALVQRRPFLTGLATCLAMFSKEEAVIVPLILVGWAWILHRDDGQRRSSRVRTVVQLTWPSCVALGFYLSMRAQTAAITPFNSPSHYRFTTNPMTVLGNGLEYLDRSCTFAAVVILIACLLTVRRPRLTSTFHKIGTLSLVWFCGAFALTLFLPVRSSLYAVWPSTAVALAAGCLLQDLWSQSTPNGRRRLVIGAGLLPVLLLPVYWARNDRWTEIADLSAETFNAVAQVSAKLPTVERLAFQDDPTTRRSFANTFGELLPQAVRLAAGREIPTTLETATVKDDQPPSVTSTEGTTIRIVLRDGRVSIVE